MPPLKKTKPKKKQETNATPMIIKDNQGNPLATYDPSMIETIKNTVANGATDEELYMFLSIASNYNLDPFLKEIWFIKYKTNDKPQIYTSRDGMVKIAKQDPEFSKIQSNEVHENDTFEVTYENFEVSNFKHTFSAKDRGKIIGAWATITYKNKKPTFVYVDFDEYNTKKPIWRANPSAMIKKVAEKEACRLSACITGLYIEEEIKDLDDTKDDLRRENANKLKQTQSVEETVEQKETAQVIDAEIIEKEE